MYSSETSAVVPSLVFNSMGVIDYGVAHFLVQRAVQPVGARNLVSGVCPRVWAGYFGSLVET